MNIKEIIAEINRAKYALEYALEENGGELTPELLEQSDILEDLKALLAEEGIDDLGRWLKSVQDDGKTFKAEADTAARKVKNNKAYEEYIKGLIGEAMDCLDLPLNKNGEKVAKGSYYGFKRTTSNKSEVNYDGIEREWGTIAEDAFREAGLPEWLHIVFKTTTTELRDAGAEAYLLESSTPAVSFTKPRANKEA